MNVWRHAGLWQEALAFLEEMSERRIDPDAYAYNNAAWPQEKGLASVFIVFMFSSDVIALFLLDCMT